MIFTYVYSNYSTIVESCSFKHKETIRKFILQPILAEFRSIVYNIYLYIINKY